ncbi:MAG: homoserine kinase [Burkholderiales bacterium]|nr:MAG: homoserine kinase [Burkholderiales bacterium]
MAVFTPVPRAALDQWLSGFEVGAATAFEGIAAGIENSNYFVTTTGGRYVLTLFERIEPAELPFYLQLMQHLAARDVPCPDPVPDRLGRLWSELCGKPAALVTRLPGRAQMRPDRAHCRQVGELLSRMHLGARDYPGRRLNPRGPQWWPEATEAVMPFLSPGQVELLREALAVQARFTRAARAASLPASAVHADLFRDNVLFDQGRLTGVIDFYFAGWDSWLFDIAVAVNDWCIDDDAGALDDTRVDALLAAYEAHRPLLAAERASWPEMQQAAALRFWLSRLYDLHLPRPAELVTPKDPGLFERILRLRVEAPHRMENDACKS